ncbi:hypothetical protein VKT23_015156 [Stygiomarasmius scandens]|uniref:Uncharacterized protein n=1 Tax=Marasmiellus scandens TaxID=2682957 RepID=A0ABR1IYP7_9AGAR
MSSGNVFLMLDAAELLQSFSGGWHATDQNYYFGGHMAVFGGMTNDNQTGSFDVIFQGTDIAFFGETDGTSTFQVAIDNNGPFDAAALNFGAQSNYTQWYQIPPLQDGIHIVRVSELQGGLDYLVITAGPSTSFNETTNVMVDDDDTSEILYKGSWDRNTDIIMINGGRPNGPPLGNTTHRTSTVGNSFIFQFAGTSVSLYGVFLGTATGSVDVEFNLDGQVSTTRIFVSPGAPPAFDESPNYLHFGAKELTAGNHTLSANITDASGSQKFILDYILYTPSFSSLASKPNFDLPELPSSSARSGPIETGPANSQTNSSAPTGAIVGGVVGGFIVILLAIILFWYQRRRYLLESRSSPMTPYLQTHSPALPDSKSILPGNTFSQAFSTKKKAITPKFQAREVGSESIQSQINAIKQQIHELKNGTMQDCPPVYSVAGTTMARKTIKSVPTSVD